MKKILFYASLLCIGICYSSCKKDELVPENEDPSWLGESIYSELKNPKQLEGTFNTYLSLVDDLGYDQTLARTGSKTIFPANDEAFKRFFAENDWGVKSYDDLTEAMKKQLLYSSMLDNALLLGMLPNVSSGTADVVKGMAVKHPTNVSVIDIVENVTPEKMPKNNSFWMKNEKRINDGKFYAVYDATNPMMVHFTREHMINNGITTLGEGSDFEILTGSPYTEGSAYIFDKKVVVGDVTCQNGYIHQVDNVIVPPGNMGQVLRSEDDTKYFSRILDYFSAPYYDAVTTNNYNDWALTNGQPTIDSIFQIRYLSTRSQASSLNRDPNGIIHSNTELLNFDPGWNGYYPANSGGSGMDYSLMDIGSLFVPTDEAMWKYFCPEGNGGFIINIYGDKPNTLDNFGENLDSLFSKKPTVLTAFANNLMKPSFVSTVPSKFDAITNDASENMGMNKSLLVPGNNGRYDIKIANNGVIYKINELIAPDEYQSVMGPSSLYDDMKVMNVFVQDHTVGGTASQLGADMYFYLLAMNANYAFFTPDDEAFKTFYIDPTTLKHKNPEALRFEYDATQTGTIKVSCYRHTYDPETGVIGQQIGERVAATTKKSQIQDILNYHTVVMKEGEKFGTNKYYVTKHGGAIYADGAGQGSKIYGGMQLDNGATPATIRKAYPTSPSDTMCVYNEKNGVAFRIDHIIQPTVNSVYSILEKNSQFSMFLDICSGFDNADLLEWAGISSEKSTTGGTSMQDRYQVFVDKKGLDYNVNMLSSYNYTLYAPNNDAMNKAFALGLPKWSEIEALFEPYRNTDSEDVSDQELRDKSLALAMINELRSFVRYQFQNNSVFADNVITANKYQTLLSDELGIAQTINVSGGQNVLKVQDVSGTEHQIKANGTLKTNILARDYVFDASKESASSIVSSSFVVIHEVDDAMNFEASKRYDSQWANVKAKARTKANYKKNLQLIKYLK
ncbi:MAG: fasciclin domain-containing protein [Prevotellaceae bacterium]|nr:fasciclin domain-containing protein [Prevotellaceae bacterium]